MKDNFPSSLLFLFFFFLLLNTGQYGKIFLHNISQKQTGKLELRTQIKREWYMKLASAINMRKKHHKLNETFDSLKSGHTSHMKSGNPDPIKPHIKKTERIKKSLTVRP